MKGYAAGIIAMLAVLFALGAAAQTDMRLYVEAGALEEGQIRQVLALLEQDAAQWTLMEDERTLRELVLAGDAPDLAICPPAAAQPWAKEGLLLALQGHIGSQQRMQRQVLDLCVEDESLFMAPLIARHRQIAVNRRLMEEMGLGYMLDEQTYPVWYPSQFYQILEEFLLHGTSAMDVWRANMDNCIAMEALTQAFYGGMLLSEDGSVCEAGSAAMCAGVQWLADAVDDQLIGYCETREEALDRFINEETAIYIDWTPQLEKRLIQTTEKVGLELAARPYPSVVGLPVRSFDVLGICAFSSGDHVRDAGLVQACAAVHEHAQEMLGQRGIWQDGALWPASLDGGAGTTLRSLFCSALALVIEDGQPAQKALAHVQAAMDALKQAR